MIVYLDEVIDEPLKCGEGTNHDDPRAKSSPESLESESLGR